MENVVRATRWLAVGAVVLFAIAWITGRGFDIALAFMVLVLVLVVAVVAAVDLVVR